MHTEKAKIKAGRNNVTCIYFVVVVAAAAVSICILFFESVV